MAGAEYNVARALNLPPLPVGDETLTHRRRDRARRRSCSAPCWRAVGGGKAGERYHRKVDRAGFPD